MDNDMARISSPMIASTQYWGIAPPFDGRPVVALPEMSTSMRSLLHLHLSEDPWIG